MITIKITPNESSIAKQALFLYLLDVEKSGMQNKEQIEKEIRRLIEKLTTK